MVPWLEAVSNGVVLKLVIQPRASRTEITGPHGDPPRLKVRVAAPPVEGEANEELVAFLSKKLRIPKTHIEVVRGTSSKTKDVFCAGIDAASTEAILSSHAGLQ